MTAQDIFQTSEFREELALRQAFMTKVYGWMTAGLLLTAATALVVADVPAITQLVYGTPGVAIGAMIAELVVVLVMVFAVRVLPAAVLSALFILYSLLTGVTLSVVLLAYTRESVGATFFITAGMFASMTVWGYVTKRDLTSLGSFAIMGLWGLFLAMIVNFFIHSSMMGFIISGVGVLVFTALTAYDTQKIAQGYAQSAAGSAEQRKTAVWGALTLYLDFINLFLYLLRFMGDRRN